MAQIVKVIMIVGTIIVLITSVREAIRRRAMARLVNLVKTM